MRNHSPVLLITLHSSITHRHPTITSISAIFNCQPSYPADRSTLLYQVDLEKERMKVVLKGEATEHQLQKDSRTVLRAVSLERRMQIGRRRMYAAFFWWRPGFESFKKPRQHLEQQLRTAVVEKNRAASLMMIWRQRRWDSAVVACVCRWQNSRLRDGADHAEVTSCA